MKQWIEEFLVFQRAAKLNYKICPSLALYITFSSFCNAVRPLIVAYFSALIINSMLAGAKLNQLIFYVILTVFIQLILNLSVRLSNNRAQIKRSLWNSMCTNYLNEISSHMDYEYFENSHIKEIYTRVCNANNNGEGLYKINDLLAQFIDSITKIVGSFSLLLGILFSVPETEQSGIFLFVNSWYIAPVFVAILLTKTLVQGKINSKMTQKVYNAWGDTARPTNFYERMYSLGSHYENGMDLRIFCEGTTIQHKIQDFIHNPYGITNISMLWTKNSIYQYFIDSLFIAFQYFIVVTKSLSGAFGIGNLVLYSQTLSSFSSGILSFTNIFVELKSNNRFIQDLFEYIDLPNKMYSGTKSLQRCKYSDYEVEFRHVSFRYPDTDNYVLKDINVKLNLGERLNIVGMNGSGKTTFVKLLCRLYDPTDGQIFLNGVNITDYKYDEYMAFFSVVFQDFKLFAFTLGQNVAVSNTYNAERVRQCLQDAGFGERLSSLSAGIDTFLYKNFETSGVEISGGEAQKTVIARALYKESTVIIMDEPTAALDPIAEYEIYSNFQNIVKDRAAICISHRLSSCRVCDRILVFDEGKIVQDGSHEALVKEDGKYQELWNVQAQYYISNKDKDNVS